MGYNFTQIDEFAFEEFLNETGDEAGELDWNDALDMLKNTFELTDANWKHIQHSINHVKIIQNVDVLIYLTAYRLAHLIQENNFFDIGHSSYQQAFDLIINVEKNQEKQNLNENENAFIQFINEGNKIILNSNNDNNSFVDYGLCPFGADCLMQFIDTHGEHSNLICSKPLSCPHLGDIFHIQKYIHICPRFSGCDELDQNHFSNFKHRQPLCSQELNHLINPQQYKPCSHDLKDIFHFSTYLHRCTKIDCHEINHYSHLMYFWHPQVHKIQRTLQKNNDVVITYKDFVLEVDLATLINPIKQWKYSPRHPVLMNGETGFIIGSYMDGNWNETDTVLVELKNGSATPCSIGNLSSFQTQTNSPLGENCVKVWRSQKTTESMMKFLNSEVMPDKTAAQVLKIITDANIPVYIIGGAVRDLAEGKNISSVKDIDLAFGCSPQELAALLRRNNINTDGPRNTGLIRFGDFSSSHYVQIEGKPMLNFIGSISNNILTRDVALDVFGKDLSINSLYYDVLNNTIVDPSGNGIQDLARKIIRPPCNNTLWSVWMGDNPNKIIRVIEFMIRRPEYITPNGFIRSIYNFLHDHGNQQNCVSKIPVWYSNQLLNKAPEIVEKFKKIAIEQFRYDFSRAIML